MGAKTDMMFLASKMHFCKNCILAINYLLAVDTDRPPPDKHYIHLVCCGTHRSLQNNTICSSPYALPRVYQAARSSEKTCTIKYSCERKQNAKNSVKKLQLYALSLLWPIHSCYYIIHETENGVPKLWACAGG